MGSTFLKLFKENQKKQAKAIELCATETELGLQSLDFFSPALVCVLCRVLSCSRLCDPVDRSPPGSSVHGIFQARMLEWVTISSSREIFLTQGSNSVSSISCTSRQILYHWATWEAPTESNLLASSRSQPFACFPLLLNHETLLVSPVVKQILERFWSWKYWFHILVTKR